MNETIRTYLYNEMVGRLIALVVGAAMIVATMRFIKSRTRTHVRDDDARYRALKTLDVATWLLVIVVAVVIFSDKLGGFTVALGVAGAGIAFALQEVIASVAGWLAVMFGGFYRTGDRVQLGGIRGDVIDVGIIRTTIMEMGQWVDGDLYNGRIVRIANSFVFKEPVFNYSGDFPFLWDEVKIPVMFGSDYDEARALFEAAAAAIAGELTDSSQLAWHGMVNKYMIEDARTSPWVTLTFNDNWVEFTIRFVVGYKARRGTKDLLFTRLLRDVEATQGRVRFASATFQLVDAPTLAVRMVGK